MFPTWLTQHICTSFLWKTHYCLSVVLFNQKPGGSVTSLSFDPELSRYRVWGPNAKWLCQNVPAFLWLPPLISRPDYDSARVPAQITDFLPSPYNRQMTNMLCDLLACLKHTHTQYSHWLFPAEPWLSSTWRDLSSVTKKKPHTFSNYRDFVIDFAHSLWLSFDDISVRIAGDFRSVFGASILHLNCQTLSS